MEETTQKQIEKIVRRYTKNVQLEMQRFANEILNLKFGEKGT